jgi:rhodanese-related sulfurtransferase
MKRIKILSISMVVAFFSSCSNAQTTSNDLAVDQFEQKLKDLDNEQLLDVRTPEEYKEGHLEGSVNIDYYNENFSTQLDALDKDKPVMVYCRSGSRSSKAAEILRQKGFKQVYELEEGIIGWQQKNKPLAH